MKYFHEINKVNAILSHVFHFLWNPLRVRSIPILIINIISLYVIEI